MAQQRSRYSQFLVELKLNAFETVSTLVVLVLLADFALKEIMPIMQAVLHLFHAP